MSPLPEGLEPQKQGSNRAMALANARLLLDQVEAQPSADFALVAISADDFCEATGSGTWERALCAAVSLLRVALNPQAGVPASVVRAVQAALAALPIERGPPVYSFWRKAPD